jgi:hypothetical protein
MADLTLVLEHSSDNELNCTVLCMEYTATGSLILAKLSFHSYPLFLSDVVPTKPQFRESAIDQYNYNGCGSWGDYFRHIKYGDVCRIGNPGGC